jgi:DNA-binding NarL/FixJ family response regulator
MIARSSTQHRVDTAGRKHVASANDTRRITIALGQFSTLVGRGLIDVLREDKSLRLIGRNLDRAALGRALAERKPDIAILDEASVTEPFLLPELLAARPEIRLIVMAHLPSRAYAGRLLAAGATCLSKDACAADIRATVRHAAEGRHHMITLAVALQDKCSTWTRQPASRLVKQRYCGICAWGRLTQRSHMPLVSVSRRFAPMQCRYVAS